MRARSDAIPPEALDTTTYDVIVVGGGAGGLMVALTSACSGLSTCLVEGTGRLGGTTATSGGTVWLPGNPRGLARTSSDYLHDIHTYFDGEVGPGDTALRSAFLESVEPTLAFLEASSNLRFTMNDPYPDYHSEAPGAAMAGRALTPVPFDARRMGAFFERIRPPIREYMVLGGMMVGRTEIPLLVRPWASWRALRTTLLLGLRYLADRLVASRGRRLYLGNALVAPLADALRRRGGHFSFGTRLTGLVQEDGRVVGIDCSSAAGPRTLRARRGVVLATGGFSSNLPLFRELTGLTHVQHSGACPEDRGDGLEAARRIGAGFADGHRTGAFWMPVSVLRRSVTDISIYPHIRDRPKPGLICIDETGRRFVNESASYHDVCDAMLRILAQRPKARFHLLCDRAFIWNYGIGMIHPVWQRLRSYVECGYLIEAPTIDELAAKLGVDHVVLSETASRHNMFAMTGEDLDVGKGSTRYNRFNGDATVRPNPCLAPIAYSPFYAVEVFPAPIGTSAGLKTDVDGRVLAADGAVIEGLFAAGNDMASVMRGAYPGPGITLGPHLVFAYRTAQAITRLEEMKESPAPR